MTHKISDGCITCGQCKSECPIDYISEGDIYTIDQDAYIDCGSYADVCPVDTPHRDC